jgi:hypothetical protein
LITNSNLVADPPCIRQRRLPFTAALVHRSKRSSRNPELRG